MSEQKERLTSGEVIRKDSPDESLESSREMNLEMASAAQRIIHTGKNSLLSMYVRWNFLTLCDFVFRQVLG